MRIRKSILLMGLSLLLLAGCGIVKGGKANGKDVPANPIEKEGYKLIYSDEFDGDDLDTKKWLPQYFPHATSVAAGCSAKYRFEDGSICLYKAERSDEPAQRHHLCLSVWRLSCIALCHLMDKYILAVANFATAFSVIYICSGRNSPFQIMLKTSTKSATT